MSETREFEPGVESGSQWCDAHWGRVREEMERNGANGIICNIILISGLLCHPPFVELRDVDAPEAMNAAMAEVGPICCYLGDGALSVALSQSYPRQDAGGE